MLYYYIYIYAISLYKHTVYIPTFAEILIKDFSLWSRAAAHKDKKEAWQRSESCTLLGIKKNLDHRRSTGRTSM